MSSTPAQSIGHRAVLPPLTNASVAALSSAALQPFIGVPTTDLSDVVGRLYTMSPMLHALYSPMRQICGTAVTVKASPGDNWAIHGGLSLAGAGHVLVVDWRGNSESCGSGARALAPAIERGLAGVVIDGAWRDIPDLQALDFPIIGTGVSAFSPGKRALGEINVPVSCGGVVVCPGDLVIGDGEGVVVVPREHIELVARAIAPNPSVATTSLSERISRLAGSYWAEIEANGGARPSSD